MKKQGRIISATVLMIFLITQVTWSFNSCPTCFSRSLPTFTNTDPIQSCCGSQKKSKPAACSSCGGECRCSSLETYDDIEGVVSVVFSMKTVDVESHYMTTYAQNLAKLLKPDQVSAIIDDSPPPQMPLALYLFFKTDILRN